jgi:hypothetical protein
LRIANSRPIDERLLRDLLDMGLNYIRDTRRAEESQISATLDKERADTVAAILIVTRESMNSIEKEVATIGIL